MFYLPVERGKWAALRRFQEKRGIFLDFRACWAMMWNAFSTRSRQIGPAFIDNDAGTAKYFGLPAAPQVIGV